jgi:hypothetical protein
LYPKLLWLEQSEPRRIKIRRGLGTLKGTGDSGSKTATWMFAFNCKKNSKKKSVFNFKFRRLF